MKIPLRNIRTSFEGFHRILELEMDPVKAIDWAMRGNTTRKGQRPGGLGLKLIREFVDLNGGRIVVVSGSGYWRFAKGEVKAQSFDRRFGGTAVTIVINTADETSYRLKNEVDPSTIF